MAGATLSRQTPTVGAGCLNWARPDLRGGRPERDVPTAIAESSALTILTWPRRIDLLFVFDDAYCIVVRYDCDMSKAADLPNDVDALKSLVLERSTALEAAEALLISRKLELEKLRFEIACLKRMKYGRSSEQLDQQLTQMQFTLEDLESSLAEKPEAARPAPKEPPQKPVRQVLPSHLPRVELVHETPCTCPACGGALRPLGEDVSEMIEYVPERYRVIRHVCPKQTVGRSYRLLLPVGRLRAD